MAAADSLNLVSRLATEVTDSFINCSTLKSAKVPAGKLVVLLSAAVDREALAAKADAITSKVFLRQVLDLIINLRLGRSLAAVFRLMLFNGKSHGMHLRYPAMVLASWPSIDGNQRIHQAYFAQLLNIACHRIFSQRLAVWSLNNVCKNGI